VNKVLTERRKQQLDQRPLTLNEFIAAFASTYCVYKQDYEKWRVELYLKIKIIIYQGFEWWNYKNKRKAWYYECS